MKVKTDRNGIILAGIILFFVSANIVWIKENQAPPMWDQTHYLFNSEILYHTLTKEGLIPFLSAFTGIMETKAPLITVLPIPFYLLIGDNYAGALCVNLFFVFAGGYYLFKLGALISGEKEALLSVFVLNAFPLIFAMSREFLVEYGLMVFVVIWMYYLLKSSIFEDKKYAYVLGVVLGLGMLMKISFPLYIFFPTVYLLAKRNNESRQVWVSSLKNIVVVLITGILISGIWYFKNLRHVVNFALASGFGPEAKNWGMGEVFSVETILSYWTCIINNGISSYFFFLVILLAVTKRILFKNGEVIPTEHKTRFYFLLIWFTVPLIIFTFGVNKEYRYTAPLYPALALLLSITFFQVFRKKYAIMVLGILLLFPLFNYLFVSFSEGHVNVQMKQLTLLNNHLAFAHPPIKEKWPNEKLVDALYRDCMKTNNDHALTTLLFDHPYVNFISLNYYSEKNGLPIRFDTTFPSSKETIAETIATIKQRSSYLMTKSDKLGPDSTNVRNTLVEALLNKGELNGSQVLEIPFPDQTLARIYKIHK